MPSTTPATMSGSGRATPSWLRMRRAHSPELIPIIWRWVPASQRPPCASANWRRTSSQSGSESTSTPSRSKIAASIAMAARSAVPGVDGLADAKDAAGVVAGLDPPQAVIVRAVVGLGPVLQVRIREVLEHAPGSPGMDRCPGPGHPPLSGRRSRGGHRGIDHRRVLELEQLVAMDEGGGVGRHAVVRPAPRHEVQLAGLARYSLCC